jgi:NADH-quinone oxidoreductase subunit C
MNFEATEIIQKTLEQKLKVKCIYHKAKQDFIEISPLDLKEAAFYLFSKAEYYFDLLNCITCIDNGVEDGTLTLTYTLSSITKEISLHLKTTIKRDLAEAKISTVSNIWATAEWHEREIYDLFGVKFSNHKDLRRILLPADWVGHPLRKDYQDAEEYHSIKIKY